MQPVAFRFRAAATWMAALPAAIAISGCAIGSGAKSRDADARLPSVDVASYMGEWKQVAHIPNWFQRQCVSGTKATYKLLERGQIEVRNECQTKSGPDSVVGLARPRAGATVDSGQLRPASLEVAFAPQWLRWMPLVWANYDVVYLSPDRRVAIVTEPSRTYMWVLSRTSDVDASVWRDVESRLAELGFARDQWVKDRS
ncbi:apolipoprotein D and lipocalin family protein [Variovorax sp. OV329]|nr:apolipoprotein D and lipocalin family protein [Variovorax sp. OV329]